MSISPSNITYFNLPYPDDLSITVNLDDLNCLLFKNNTINNSALFSSHFIPYDSPHIYSPWFISKFYEYPKRKKCNGNCNRFRFDDDYLDRTNTCCFPTKNDDCCKRLTFYSLQQYITYHLAKYFNNKRIMQQALTIKDPFALRSLQDQLFDYEEFVRGDDDILCQYLRIIEHILIRGNILKFSQNPELLQRITSNYSQLFVFANQFDIIMGAGLTEEEARLVMPYEYPGLNLLGLALLKARQVLKTSGDNSPNFNVKYAKPNSLKNIFD